jgi:hypothetical protein
MNLILAGSISLDRAFKYVNFLIACDLERHQFIELNILSCASNLDLSCKRAHC